MRSIVPHDYDRSRIKVLPVPTGFPVRHVYERMQDNHEEITYLEATSNGDRLLRFLKEKEGKLECEDCTDKEVPRLSRVAPVVGRDGWYFLRKKQLQERNVSWLEYKNTAWVWADARTAWKRYQDYLVAAETSVTPEVLHAIAVIGAEDTGVKLTDFQQAILKWYVMRRKQRMEHLRAQKLLPVSLAAALVNAVNAALAKARDM